MRTSSLLLTCLSILSLSDLEDVTRRLCLRHSRRKLATMHAILNDFLRERLQFCDTCNRPSNPWMVLACEYFNARYGTLVATAFHDLLVPFHVEQQMPHLPHAAIYGDTWLMLCYDNMFSRMSRLSKEIILRQLHLIPAHIRPLYNSCSICSSCQHALLHHIRAWIMYLSSLSTQRFVQTFSSVLPFHAD